MDTARRRTVMLSAVMPMSPLDHPKLRAIEQYINSGQFQRAQRLLGALEAQSNYPRATAYLTTRLMFERGRLDAHSVARLLRHLIDAEVPFPEALELLQRAESGRLFPLSSCSAPRVRDTEPASPLAAQRAVSQPPGDQHRSERADRQRSNMAYNTWLQPRSSDIDSPSAVFRSVSGQSSRWKTRSAPPPSPLAELHSSHQVKIPKAPGVPKFVLAARRPTNQPPRAAKRPRTIEDAPPTDIEPLMARHRSRFASAPQSSRLPESVSCSKPTIRSANPGHLPTDAVAALVETGRFEEALDVLDTRDTKADPVRGLLAARALLGLEARAEALSALQGLGDLSGLEPELHIDCAQLWLELGDPIRAREQASFAAHAEPGSPTASLYLAWAHVRLARRTRSREHQKRAYTLLRKLKWRSDNTRALLIALRASLYVEADHAERALAEARAALLLNPLSVDALATVAIASARLGRVQDAYDAHSRLMDFNPVEADVVKQRLYEEGLAAPPEGRMFAELQGAAFP